MKRNQYLSIDDKKQLLLKIFKNNSTFFTFREIESYATKNRVSIVKLKDILNELLIDNLIQHEKIGTQDFYWATPSQMYTSKKTLKEKLLKEEENINNEIISIENKINDGYKERKDSEKRKKYFEKLNEILIQTKEYETIITGFIKFDPERKDELILNAKKLNDLYEFWSDNIFCISQWLIQNGEKQKIDKIFPDLANFNLFD